MPREIRSRKCPLQESRSFDGLHRIGFSEESHRYRWLCSCHKGEDATGVTTFLKAGLPTAPGLISWMKGQALEYLWNATINRPIDLEAKTELFKAAKLADRTKSQEAADIGTVLHSFGELHSLGKIDEANALLQQVSGVEQYPVIMKCVEKYLEWAAQNSGEIISAEALVASPIYNFCGKLDLVSRRKGKIVLSDYKTSKAVFLEHKVQLAAYRLALRQWSNIQVDAIEVLRFPKTGDDFEVVYVDDPKVLQALEDQAIRCRQTHSFIKEFEK